MPDKTLPVEWEKLLPESAKKAIEDARERNKQLPQPKPKK